jgi:peroxiredoxin
VSANPGLGDPLPDFALAGLDGKTWTGADLLGSAAVVFCFATW